MPLAGSASLPDVIGSKNKVLQRSPQYSMVPRGTPEKMKQLHTLVACGDTTAAWNAGQKSGSKFSFRPLLEADDTKGLSPSPAAYLTNMASYDMFNHPTQSKAPKWGVPKANKDAFVPSETMHDNSVRLAREATAHVARGMKMLGPQAYDHQTAALTLKSRAPSFSFRQFNKTADEACEKRSRAPSPADSNLRSVSSNGGTFASAHWSMHGIPSDKKDNRPITAPCSSKYFPEVHSNGTKSRGPKFTFSKASRF